MKKIAFTLTLILSLFIVYSCKHEACTKPEAINFDSNAEKDDGSCQFQSQVVFWYNQWISDSLTASGTDELTYYVNDISLGTAPTNQYWNDEPDCALSTLIKFDVEMDSHEKAIYVYEVYNEANEVVWTGSINFFANECHKIALYN